MILIDGGAINAMSPAQRAAAAGTVEVTIERIQQIANTQVAAMAQAAAEHERSFRNLEVSEAAFGQVPAAQQLGHQHRAAQQVFVETIKGLLADLEEFRDALVASAKAHESTDDAAYAALSSLGSRYASGTVLHSQKGYEGERVEQGSALARVDGAPAEPAAPTQPAGDQAPGSGSDGTGFGGGSGAQDA